MTYNERVRMIAEEMAKDEDMRLVGYDRWHEQAYKQYFKSMINGHFHNARIAVAKMAEAATEFLGSLSEYGVQKRLSEYGLIPDKTGDRAVTG